MKVASVGLSINTYLKLRRALGREFAQEGRILASLAEFLIKSATNELTNSEFDLWCKTFSHVTRGTRRSRMRIVRNFCLYCRRTDPECFVPDIHTFPTPHQPIQPYIYTEAQITKLLIAASRLPTGSNSPMRPNNYHLAIVLLYTAGLRRGELARLKIGDCNLKEGVLHIRETKFHKSRYVPLSADAFGELEKFLAKRKRLQLPMQPDSPLLWNACSGEKGYTGAGLAQGIHQLLIATNTRRKDGTIPRIHDFRFSFAIHALLRWYRAGINVQNRLPTLATYMGHVSIISTEYYLPFVPELSMEASKRFCDSYGAAVQPLAEENS
jgi:integrase/recombinase XerD